MNKPTKNLIFRWALRMAIYLAITTALVFLTAGDWTYLGGWWFAGLQIFNTIGTGLLLVATRADLVARRSQVGEGTQGWDQILARLMAFSTLIISVVAALGFRFFGRWGISVWSQIVGALLASAGHLLTIWSMRVNPFFEATTRIQSEHGHYAVNKGPYRWVRHPGYLGLTLYNGAMSLVMNSVLAWLGFGLFLIVLVWRTVLEDSFLRENLKGYANYAKVTRWRLIPGVW